MDSSLKDALAKLPKPEVALVDKGGVQVHPDNPRQGNVGLIYESIRTNGWYGHIYVQKSTGNIFIGNHRFMAGSELGMARFPALIYDIDDLTAKRLMLVDNKTADEASYDDQKTVNLLVEQAEEYDPLLTGTGYHPNELDEMIEGQEESLSFDGNRRLTPEEKKHIYDSNTIREVKLLMNHKEFDWALGALRRVADQRNLEDNTSVVLALLADAVGEEAP